MGFDIYYYNAFLGFFIVLLSVNVVKKRNFLGTRGILGRFYNEKDIIYKRNKIGYAIMVPWRGAPKKGELNEK